MNNRRILESPIEQGEDEVITYTLTTTPWASAPVNVAVQVLDVTGGEPTDVSAATLSGPATVAGDVITLPALGGLKASHVYRLEIRFTAGGNTYEPYAEIIATQ